jgi:hypothetical protein
MMPYSSRSSIVAGCCLLVLLIVASREPAWGFEGDSNAPAANDAAVRRRILAHWRARQEQSKTFHFAWDSRSVPPKKWNAPVREGHMELWMDGEIRFRLETSSARKAQPNDKQASQSTFDGATSRQLSLDRQSAVVRSDDDGTQLNGIAVFPLLLALRPLSRGGVARASQPLRVLTDNAIIDNKHYLKVERQESNFVDTFWLDPARDDAIVRWERARRGNVEAAVSIEYQRDKTYGWVPARFSQTNSANGYGFMSENTVTRFTFDARFPDETFTITFPPGTAVVDWMQAEKYVVAQDGSKTDVRKYDSPGTLKIYEALEQVVEFNIDEQPLKDVLDFIAQRYQIKVVLDAQAIRQRLIDPSIAVKMPYSGIKLKSLMNILLEQSRKPLAYQVRQGVLTVIPAKK